ncbi:MAG: TraE/TraK family type IV conjugative transfer system protein [Pigmentiphaga sp.]
MFRRSSRASVDPLAGKPASYGIHRYLQSSSNLFEENRLLKLSIAGLFGITAVLGTVMYTSAQNQRTVVVPFGASGDLYVTGAKPSEAYLRTITFNVVSLSGTYSAYSADRQFQELLSIAHPSAYNAMGDNLNRLLDELADNPTLSIATYIRPDQPVTWTDRKILVPVERCA